MRQKPVVRNDNDSGGPLHAKAKPAIPTHDRQQEAGCLIALSLLASSVYHSNEPVRSQAFTC